MQLQQRRDNSLDDSHKTSVGSSTDMKPPLASLGQSSVIIPADTSSGNKVPVLSVFLEHDVNGVMSPLLYFCVLMLLL